MKTGDLSKLLQAIWRDDLPTARRLLKADPCLATAQAVRPTLFETPILHWLYAGDTALHLAAAGHRAAIVRLLLAAGADPNAAGNHRLGRPLHYAADFQASTPPLQQVRTLECLLEAGADINAADKNGATALHRAVRTRTAAAVDCLLRSGADPLAKNLSGATPFHLAVQNTGKSGSGTPAAKIAQRKIIQLFLACGLSPATPDAHGKSVLDWAMSAWIRQLLVDPSGR